MKKYFLIVLCAAVLAVLSACGCNHQWQQADCEHGKVCSLCAAEEGLALGHNWKEADCKNPRTCQTCAKTEGEAQGHDYLDATCEEPQKCQICGLYNGSRLEHDWSANTCKDLQTCKLCGQQTGGYAAHTWTEPTCHTLAECTVCGLTTGYYAEHTWLSATDVAPMTCAVCGETQGIPWVAHEDFKLVECAPYIGVWQAQWNIDGEKWFGVSLEDMDLDFSAAVTLEITDYGKMVLTVAYDETHKAVYRTAMIERVYSYLRDVKGLTGEEAQEYMLIHNGCTVEEYVDRELPYEPEKVHVYLCYYSAYDNTLCGGTSNWAMLDDFVGTVEYCDENRMVLTDPKMGQLAFQKQA